MTPALESNGAVCCLLDNSGEAARRPAAGNSGDCPSFSVVICTDNRLHHLKRTLSALQYQDYPNFEVCVVAGPTEDGTREFLAASTDRLKVATCDVRNLSQSRNIGIALAAGDVVAFIDDDAVPEPEWLTQLARSYDDERVGAVGGVVHDHIGIDYQARFVTVNRLGQPREESRPSPELNFPGSAQFPHLLGTNCSFRRSALADIGGFDETYEYFLDETDVCCRINDAGYRIVQRPDAFIHHKYAPSALRDEQRVVRNWYPIIKNRLYFGLRHGRDWFDAADVVEAGLGEKDFWQRDVAEKARAGVFSNEDVERFQTEAQAAIEDGLRLSTHEPRLLPADQRSPEGWEFRRIVRAVPPEGRTNVLYLSPAADADFAQCRELLSHARHSAGRGHQVHLVIRSAETASVDYDDGLWIYDLGTGSWTGAGAQDKALLEAVERIASRRWIDVAYCLRSDRVSLQLVAHLLSQLNKGVYDADAGASR